jgi:hypothetical protein
MLSVLLARKAEVLAPRLVLCLQECGSGTIISTSRCSMLDYVKHILVSLVNVTMWLCIYIGLLWLCIYKALRRILLINHLLSPSTRFLGGVFASADAARVGGGLYQALVEALCTLATDPSVKVRSRHRQHSLWKYVRLADAPMVPPCRLRR